MNREKIICIVLAVAAAALAVFGVERQLRVSALDARVNAVSEELTGEKAGAEALRGELEAARSDAQTQIDALNGELSDITGARDALQAELEAVTGERDGLREDLTRVTGELTEAQAQIEELSAQHPFDPEGPEYQKLYPDFYAPQPLTADKVEQNVIYLTFDDGPSARTDEILATLAQEDVKATFFIVGSSADGNRAKVKEIYDAGHTVAMHSWSHDYYKIYSSTTAFLDDMYKVFCLIRDTTGVAPTYFRFPGGSNNGYAYSFMEEMMAEMLRRGFVPCDWNMSAGDAVNYTVSAESITNNILRDSAVSRGFVLMHDSYYRTTTAQALPQIIAGLREKGFTFAPLTPDVKPVLFNYGTVSRDG